MLTIDCEGASFCPFSIWAEAEEAALDFEPFPGSGSTPGSLRGHADSRCSSSFSAVSWGWRLDCDPTPDLSRTDLNADAEEVKDNQFMLNANTVVKVVFVFLVLDCHLN